MKGTQTAEPCDDLLEGIKQSFAEGHKEACRLAHRQLQDRKMQAGEDVEVFLRALERLIDRAASNLPNDLRNRQLIDYFLEGLPTPVADQLFILAPKALEETVTRARELMLLEKRRGLRARRIAGITACEDDDEEESASGHIM